MLYWISDVWFLDESGAKLERFPFLREIVLERGAKAQRPVWRPILGLSRVFHSPCPPPQSLIDRSTRRDIYLTAKKIWFVFSQQRNCAALSPNFHIHVSVSDLNRHQDRIHRKGNKLERRPVLFAVVFFGSTLLPFHSACRLYCTCFTERLSTVIMAINFYHQVWLTFYEASLNYII
jgi:hypothetical protein